MAFKRCNRVTIGLTDMEYAKLRKHVREAHQNESSYCRQAVFDRMKADDDLYRGGDLK